MLKQKKNVGIEKNFKFENNVAMLVKDKMRCLVSRITIKLVDQTVETLFFPFFCYSFPVENNFEIHMPD